MKIYTSYFGKQKKLREAGIKIVGIAIYSPRFCKCDARIMEVAPKKFMLDLYREEYIPKYNELVLEKLDLKDFMERLKIISGGKDVALCCYEKSGDFCHRHLLAEFLNDKLNLDIEEFDYKPLPKQGELF